MRRREQRQGVVKVSAGARLVMERASFSLGRQTPARRSTLIPSTSLMGRGLQGQQPCARFIFPWLIQFVLWRVFALRTSHPSQAVPTTLHSHFCPRARHEMLYGLRGAKEQSLSARCTEPARCTVSCKLAL